MLSRARKGALGKGVPRGLGWKRSQEKTERWLERPKQGRPARARQVKATF